MVLQGMQFSDPKSQSRGRLFALTTVATGFSATGLPGQGFGRRPAFFGSFSCQNTGCRLDDDRERLRQHRLTDCARDNRAEFRCPRGGFGRTAPATQIPCQTGHAQQEQSVPILFTSAPFYPTASESRRRNRRRQAESERRIPSSGLPTPSSAPSSSPSPRPAPWTFQPPAPAPNAPRHM